MVRNQTKSMEIRKNVDFYTVVNGWATFFGNGTGIVLSNGKNYAIIDGVKYRIEFDGCNNQSIVKILS